jgi:hypothetical protein
MSRRKYRRDPQQKDRPRGYDVEMIRDFLAQLATELRVNHYEQQHQTVNPELAEELNRWFEKRGTYLTAVNSIESETGMTADEFVLGASVYRKYRMIEIEAQLDQLERLQLLFDEAFHGASHPGVEVRNPVNAREWLELARKELPEFFKDGKPDPGKLGPYQIRRIWENGEEDG